MMTKHSSRTLLGRGRARAGALGAIPAPPGVRRMARRGIAGDQSGASPVLQMAARVAEEVAKLKSLGSKP